MLLLFCNRFECGNMNEHRSSLDFFRLNILQSLIEHIVADILPGIVAFPCLLVTSRLEWLADIVNLKWCLEAFSRLVTNQLAYRSISSLIRASEVHDVLCLVLETEIRSPSSYTEMHNQMLSIRVFFDFWENFILSLVTILNAHVDNLDVLYFQIKFLSL